MRMVNGRAYQPRPGRHDKGIGAVGPRRADRYVRAGDRVQRPYGGLQEPELSQAPRQSLLISPKASVLQNLPLFRQFKH